MKSMRSLLFLLLIVALAAGCAAPPTATPTAPPQPTERPTLTPRPPRPTRQPLPTKTLQAPQPTPTQKPTQAQPTATQAQTSNLQLGRKFEGVFARLLICKQGRIWTIGSNGLLMLNPQDMSRTEISIENMVGGPWAASDWIWTYEYLNTDERTGGFLVGRDARTGTPERYLDMMQNLEWETFLLGMGEVGSEYWIGIDAPQAILIDKTSGQAVGNAELPGIARLIEDDGNHIWFAGDTLFIMKKSTQEFSSILDEYVSGLDFDGYFMYVMTMNGILRRYDFVNDRWEEILLSPDAWAGCYDGTSYWYADAFEESVQEVTLP